MKKEKEKISEIEMMDALMGNITDSIYFKDKESRFIKISKSLVERLNISCVEDALGKTDFDFFSKEHAEQAFQDEQNIIKTGIPIINIEEKETFKDSEDKWVSTTKMPLYNKNGEIIGTFGISRDITEIKRAQESLKIAKTEAEKLAKKALAADQTKSLFLANMSHEIRTPMNAIIGFSEILREQIRDPQHIKYVDIILSSGQTLLELINDILDLSKIEAGKMELNYRPVDPQALFNDIARIFSAKLKDKGLKLLTEIDEKLPKAIMLDEVRVRQILFNLVGNAVKFTAEGYVELKVKGNFYPDRSKIDLIFSVKDTGIGISEEDKEGIFNAFQQSKTQDIKKYGGTGLGLAITKKLVELMNGKIEVESIVGKGSIFKVILREVSIATMQSESDIADDSFLNIRFNQQKVLVADDIESNRLLLSKILSLYNLKVLEASNGKEAIIMAKNNKPDIILMDLRMPVMDGYEAINLLKNDNILKNIPIIVLTASAMKSDEAVINKIKCEGYIKKPVRRNELLNELIKYIEYEYTEKKEHEKEKRKKGSIKNIIKETKISAGKIVPSELMKKMEGDMSQKLEKIKKEFIINDIEDFAAEVKELGKNYNLEVLTAWSDALLKQASDFDLEGLADTISKYQLILENIKGLKD